MRIEQLEFGRCRADPTLRRAQLVFVFGSTASLEPRVLADLQDRYPSAQIVGCSTAGEILGASVRDDAVTVTAIELERATVAVAAETIASRADSRRAGERLGRSLTRSGLVHVFVLSDGLGVNGTALAAGLSASVPSGVTISGALAGDGPRMQSTVVVAGGTAASGRVVAVGFYGPHLHVGCGAHGGCDPFGPERVISRARDNVLYEVDYGSALALYRKYLGEHARGLPSTGMLFPLAIRVPGTDEAVVRTILGIDDEAQSITFAGDMPEGHYARLMRASFARLIDGAHRAAMVSTRRIARRPELAVLVSCVGRRLVLGQRVEEEVECVSDVLGPVPTIGLYSYGELCSTPGKTCELHNLTMTVTTLAES